MVFQLVFLKEAAEELAPSLAQIFIYSFGLWYHTTRMVRRNSDTNLQKQRQDNITHKLQTNLPTTYHFQSTRTNSIRPTLPTHTTTLAYTPVWLPQA